MATSCVKDDPDLAEAIAYAITTPYHQSKTLDSLAVHFRQTAPDRAASLLADAERIARSITDPGEHDQVIDSLASAVAPSDPDRAVRIARSARDPDHMAAAISHTAVSVARTGPGDVSRIASLISSPYHRANALIQAGGVAAHQEQTHEARSLFDEAESLIRKISDLDNRAGLLADLAIELGALDPGHAARIADEAEVVAKTIPDAPGLFSAAPRNRRLENIARRMVNAYIPEARTALRNHAERIARSIAGIEQ